MFSAILPPEPEPHALNSTKDPPTLKPVSESQTDELPSQAAVQKEETHEVAAGVDLSKSNNPFNKCFLLSKCMEKNVYTSESKDV